MALLPRIASGLAGWLTYQHMRHKVIHHDESALYDPITEIAESNGFRVKHDFPVPSTAASGRASQNEIDFVMVHRSGTEAVVLEVKFKKTAKEMAGSIGVDARRVRDLDAAQINDIIKAKPIRQLPICKSACKVSQAVLFVWREGAIVEEVGKNEPAPIQRQFIELLKSMFDDPNNVSSRMLEEAMLTTVPLKPVSNRLGHVRWGSTYTTGRYWVTILNRRNAWERL